MNTEKREISTAEGAVRASTEQMGRDLDQLRHKIGETERIVHWPKERINRAGRWLDEKLTPEDRQALPKVLGGIAAFWFLGRLFR